MIRVARYLILVAALVAVAVWLANDPGTAVIIWHGWRIDTSASLLLIVIVALVAVIISVLRLISALRSGFRAFGARKRERRLQRGLTALGDGFAAVHAGVGSTARRLALEAGKLIGDNPAVLMLRKQAAALDGNHAEVEAAAETLLERPETELAALKTLATNAMAKGDTEKALGYARRALARGETVPWALRTILDADIATRNWTNALAILDMRASRDMFTGSDHQRLRARLHLLQAQDLLARGEAAQAARVARIAMDENGGVAALALYAKAMAAQGKGKKAAGDIEKAWRTEPDPALLAAYRVLIPGETALELVQRVEHLVEHNPDEVESRLALAEVSLAAELWGQARNRLQGLTSEAYPTAVRARAARLMAEVERAERGDTAAVSKWLREALVTGQATPVPVPTTLAALLAEA
jgi:HemY protein